MKRSESTAAAAPLGVNMDHLDEAARGLLAFLVDVGDAPEVIWAAGLAHFERAIVEAKESRYGRFRHYPEGQLRHLRRDVSQAMKLLRLAVDLAEAEKASDRDLVQELHRAAVDEGKARRRAQTLPAQIARLEKQRRERDSGVPRENFHLRADYPAHGPLGEKF